MGPFKFCLQQKNRRRKLEKRRDTYMTCLKSKANKWKMKTFFFETAADFLSPSLSIGAPSWKCRNGLMGNRILFSCKMFPQPSDGIKQWKTKWWRGREWESTGGRKKTPTERDPTYLLYAPLCPMDPAPCSAVTLMKIRPQSLSIWPVCPSPVKDNRLAEQRHYITICRCRRARQRRDMAP